MSIRIGLADDRLRLTIADHGPGVAAADRGPFERGGAGCQGRKWARPVRQRASSAPGDRRRVSQQRPMAPPLDWLQAETR